MVIKILLYILSALLCIRQFSFLGQMITAFIWLCILIEIAWIDYRTMTIPDHWNLLLGLTGLLSIWIMPEMAVPERLIGTAVVSLPMIITDLLVPGGFGGGDIKLMAAAGLMLGGRKILTAAVLAFLAGGIYAVFLLVTGRAGRKDAFPFGPFLCGGLAAALCLI